MRFVPNFVSVPLPGLPVMQQHPRYATSLGALGIKVTRLTVFDAGPVAHLQAVQRRLGPLRVTWVPRGLIWEENVCEASRSEVYLALRTALPRSHLQLIGSSDSSEDPLLGASGFRKLTAPNNHAWLDLTAETPTRLARQHGKWRNRLRHAQSAGLRIATRPFSPETDLQLLHLEQAQRRAKGYRALPPGFTLAWARANRDAVQVFGAVGSQGIAAFIIVLIHAPTASYHIGWTGDEGRATSAHNLLLWKASCWLAERGYKALDLGMIDQKRSPGLARFKLGIGAEEQTGGATFFALPHLRLPQFRHRAT